MSDHEEDYAGTEYQGTTYQGSEDEMEEEEPQLKEPSENEAGPSQKSDTEAQHESSGISDTVLHILQGQWPSWKAAKGKKRQTIWRALVTQIWGLRENLTLEHVVWDRKLQVREIKHIFNI